MKNKDIVLHVDLATVVGQRSTCNRLKVGAVIATENSSIFIGYNGTPEGFDNNCEDSNNITKPEVIHAEMNALMKLSSSNESSKNAIVFLTHAPCLNCANMLIRAKVKKVFYKDVYRTSEGIELLKQFNIECERLSNEWLSMWR